MNYPDARDTKTWLHGIACMMTVLAFVYAGVTLAEDEPDEIESAGSEIIEACDEGSEDVPSCNAIEGGVQSRGTLIGPLSFKLKSPKYNRCLSPYTTSKGTRVKMYDCGNYARNYWTVIDGQRGSPIKGEWNADWQYLLRNNWSGLCLKVKATSTTGNQILIQTDCSSAGYVNFAPSPNAFAGEYVVIRGSSGGAQGSADRQYCIRAVSSSSPVVNSSSNTTYQCAYWSSQLWKRAAF